MKARAYQREAVDRAFDAWAKGERAHLMVAPTGAGKTLVEAMVAKRWVEQCGGRVLVLAQDSRELVLQLAQAMRRHTRLSVGVEMGDRRVSRAELPQIVCGTVQTVSRRVGDFAPGSFGLIVQDEADHAAALTWRSIADAFPSARIFGCTATPHRHDGVRVPFDSAKRAATHQELINAGHIAEIEVRDVRVVDRARIVLPGRVPVTPQAIEAVWDEEGHLHEVVEPTIRLAGTRPTIIFTPTIERAEQTAAMLNRYRPDTAAAISGRTPRIVRAGIVEQFEARNLQYLVNVGVLGRGIDFPFVSCIVMARITHSRTMYEQAIGRGWRAHPSKQRLLVLDFCENADRHRLLSTFALLTGRDVDDEVLERARERLEQGDGGEIGRALDEAQDDLVDPDVRRRIRAAVAVRTRTVDLLTESITDEDWRTKTNRQIAKEHGLDKETLRTRRPASIPSPGSHRHQLEPIDWDAQPLGKASDKEIASLVGRSQSTVVEARRRRGIASFTSARSRPTCSSCSAALASGQVKICLACRQAQRATKVRNQGPVKCASRRCAATFSLLRPNDGRRHYCSKACRWAEEAQLRHPQRMERKRRRRQGGDES